MKYRLITILLVFGMVLINLTSLHSQAFIDEPLPKVLKQWESQFGLILNYDLESLSQYTYSGSLSNISPEKDLKMVLSATPFDFIAGEQIYSIYKSTVATYEPCGIIKTQSGEPLPYANILYGVKGIGTQSDSVGSFQLSIRGYKNDQITISYLGYASRDLYLENLSECGDVILEINDQLVLQNVVIKEYLYKGVSIGADHASINFDFNRLTQDHSSVEHDVLSTIQLLPGVSSTDESATNITIRGSTPDQNLILWENSTLYDPGHLFGMISSVNPYTVDQIKLYKGVYNPKYDNRIGGLIDITLPTEPMSEVSGSIGATMTEAHGTLSVPIVVDKMSLFIGGRHNLSSIIKTPTYSNYVNRVFQNTKIDNNEPDVSEGFIEATDRLNYYDLNAKWIYKLNDRIALSASTLLTSNVFDYASNFIEERELNTDILDYNSTAISLKTHLAWSDHVSSSVSYNSSDYNNTYSSTYVDTDSDDILFALSNDNDITDHVITIDNEVEIGKFSMLNFGFISDEKSVNFSYKEERELALDYSTSFDQNEQFIHLYTAYNLYQSAHNLDLSIKVTRVNESPKSWFYSPRASYQYRFNPFWQFKLSGGRVYQFISQVRDLGITDINSGTNYWVLSEFENENWLYADKFSVGVVHINKGWLIDIEAYKNRTHNLRTINNNALDLINIDNPIGLKSQGLELLVKKQWNKYGFWLNYTLSKNQYTGVDFNEVTPSENDQRHRLSIVNSIKFKGFNLSVTYQFKTGLPLSEPTGIIALSGDDEGYYDLAYDNGVNQQRLNDYSRLDLSLSWTRQLNNIRFQSSFSLINLLNREHIAARSYLVGEDEDEFGDLQPYIFSLEKRLLGFTPRIMIRFSF